MEITPSVCSRWSQPPSPRGRQTLSVIATRCQLPRRGSFIRAGRKMPKAPPSGELAANAVSRLRGLASPWGSWRVAPEGVSTETPPVCCADSPLWDGAFGMAGEFLAKVQSFRERQRLPPLFHMEHFTSPRRRWGCGRCTRCSRPSLPGGRWRARRCRSSAGWRGRWY